MMKALVSTSRLSREDWLKHRRLGLGASDASVVCGINHYKSPIVLWLEKTGQESGESAYWGNRLEPLVRDEFTKRSGIEVIQVNHILQNTKYPHMLANVDGVCRCRAHGPCAFEAKTASSYLSDKWEDSIPGEYLLQCQHYLAITGYNGAYIAVLICGNTYKYRFIERDEEIISMLIRLEGDFWNSVTLGVPPDVDGSHACAKYLSRRYPVSVPLSRIQLPDAATDLIHQYNETRKQLEQITEQKQKAENILKEMLGNNAVGIVGGNTISWTNVSKESFDNKAFKSEQPTLYSKYASKTSYRRFVVKVANHEPIRKAG